MNNRLEEIYTPSNSKDRSFHVGKFLKENSMFSIFELVDSQGRYESITFIKTTSIIKRIPSSDYLDYISSFSNLLGNNYDSFHLSKLQDMKEWGGKLTVLQFSDSDFLDLYEILSVNSETIKLKGLKTPLFSTNDGVIETSIKKILAMEFNSLELKLLKEKLDKESNDS
mgnify:FL=1